MHPLVTTPAQVSGALLAVTSHRGERGDEHNAALLRALRACTPAEAAEAAAAAAAAAGVAEAADCPGDLIELALVEGALRGGRVLAHKASLARLLHASGLHRVAPRTHLVHCAAELHAALAGGGEDGSVAGAASRDAAAAAAAAAAPAAAAAAGGEELWFLKDAVADAVEP
jgi:hypothetical protein